MMKKKMMYGLLAFLMVSLLITGCKKSNKKETIIDDKPVTNETKENQGDLKFSNIKIEKKGATSYITGTVKNGTGKEKSFQLELIMSNSSNKRIYGRVETQIDNLKKDETRDFSITIVGDYTKVDSLEVVVK